MRALLDRAVALARAAQRRQADRIARQWGETGVRVTAGDSEVIIEARGLRRRWLTDPALRFLGMGR